MHQGEHQAVDQVAERHAAPARVGVALRVRVVLARRRAVLGADDRVVGDQLAVVDAGLRHPKALGRRRGGPRVDAGEPRQTALAAGVLQLRVDLVRRRDHQPVAVGVDEVPVDPVLLAVDQPVAAELARRDDVVLCLAVDRVPVDVQVLRETVEVAALLELRERVADLAGVEQADVVDRPVAGHRGGRGLDVPCTAASPPCPGQAVGLPGGVDVALDGRCLALVRVRRDDELLQHGGHAAPTRTLDSTSSTTAIAGSCRLRRNTATKNAAAQMIEMNSRISFAGITAFRSV